MRALIREVSGVLVVLSTALVELLDAAGLAEALLDFGIALGEVDRSAEEAPGVIVGALRGRSPIPQSI